VACRASHLDTQGSASDRDAGDLAEQVGEGEENSAKATTGGGRLASRPRPMCQTVATATVGDCPRGRPMIGRQVTTVDQDRGRGQRRRGPDRTNVTRAGPRRGDRTIGDVVQIDQRHRQP